MSLTLIIIIITSLISYQALNNREVFIKLQHHPYSEQRNKEYYRLLTSGFVHGSWMHLIINMFVLYQFGEYVEKRFILEFGETFGRLNYLILYLLTIVFADIPTYLKHRNNPGFASIGASGAVSGILFVFVLFLPWNMLLLFFIIPVPAIIAAIGYLVYSSWASNNTQDHIDHEAHFYGAIFGLGFAVLLEPRWISLFIDKLIYDFPL